MLPVLGPVCVLLVSLATCALADDAPRLARFASKVEFHRGLDVSTHSGAVDWARLRDDGHTYAFVKATEGQDLADPSFAEHWVAMKEVGLIRGAYHFYVTEDEPELQARFFIETVDLEPGDLPPVVDIELLGHATHAGLRKRLARWVEIVEAHYGVKPIIYTTARFWDAHVGGGFGEYPLWVAEYEVEAPRLPLGWTAWHFWQWRENADVPGVEKGADLTRFNARERDIAELLIGGRSE